MLGQQHLLNGVPAAGDEDPLQLQQSIEYSLQLLLQLTATSPVAFLLGALGYIY